jgi:UDP-GlcNAc:undecaprenyl-phosphate GlcNAc-1-phosphate transferase
MLPFFVTAGMAGLWSWVVLKWYTKRGWVEDPINQQHAKITHHHPVPRGGGIAIALPIIVACLLFLNLDHYLIAILTGTVLLAIVGMLDDLYNIHPWWRLAAGALAGLIVVGSGIGIAYVSHPFQEGVIHLDQPQIDLVIFGSERSIWVLSSLFAMLFITWNMNIVNWAKGVDGQMPSFVSAALIFVGLLSGRFADDPTQFDTATLCFIAAGAFAGFLVWNWQPQRMMPGYGAGSIAGFLLSIVAILSGAKVATVMMVLTIPTADAIFTIARRVLAGKSPIWGDRGHFHHKLLDVYGWQKWQIAMLYLVSSLLMGLLSLYLDTKGKILTFALASCIVFAVLIHAKWRTLESKRVHNKSNTPLKAHR